MELTKIKDTGLSIYKKNVIARPKWFVNNPNLTPL